MATTIFNQDIITNTDGLNHYNPDYMDNALSTEDNPDREIVLNGIDQLASIFATLDRVRENHKTVLSIMSHAGYDSWEDFKTDFDEELQNAFEKKEQDANARKQTQARENDEQVIDISDAPIHRLTSMERAFQNTLQKKCAIMMTTLVNERNEISTLIRTLEEDETAKKSRIKTLEEKLVELEALNGNAQTEEYTRLESVHAKLTKAVKDAHKDIRFNRGKLDGILANIDLTQAKINALTDTDNVRINILSDQPQLTASAMAGIADKMTFVIGTALQRRTSELAYQAKYANSDTGRFDVNAITLETDGGVYTKKDKLADIDDEIAEATRLFAVAQIGYDLATLQRKQDQLFWPGFNSDFWAKICESRQRAIVRARERKEKLNDAEDEIRQNGSWRTPAIV